MIVQPLINSDVARSHPHPNHRYDSHRLWLQGCAAMQGKRLKPLGKREEPKLTHR